MNSETWLILTIPFAIGIVIGFLLCMWRDAKEAKMNEMEDITNEIRSIRDRTTLTWYIVRRLEEYETSKKDKA